MNYYSWRSLDGQVGDVYADSWEEAVKKVERAFKVKIFEIELLENRTSD